MAARLIDGDVSAFDEAVLHHRGSLCRLAQRLLAWDSSAEDIVQDVFIQLWTHRQRLRLEHGDASLSRYLEIATIKRCRSALRFRIRGLRRWRIAARSEIAPRPPDPIESDETIDEVRVALRRLSPTDREVLALRYLEEWDVPRIASALGLSRSACDQRLSRARERLRALLPDDSRSAMGAKTSYV